MIFATRTFPLLLAIFAISVLVQLPLLNRSLSKHHEFCTAVSLRIIKIWSDSGIEKFGFNPAMNFAKPTDKFINNKANTSGKMIDAEGNYYYVSHPPFAYYFPFFLFEFLHIKPDVLPLQLFNIGLHFLSALFVYFIVCLLSFNRARSYPHLASVIAFTVYLFLPATLWFQGNVYMSDMAVHTLFVIGVYIALKMIIRQKFYTFKYIFFFSLILFLMIYTSWLGVFFAFGVFVYSLLHVSKIKGFRVLIATTVIITLFALRTITYQYSQINGAESYFSEMLARILVRGSLSDTSHGLFSFLFSYLLLVKTVLVNYVVNYLAVYILLLGFVWIAFTKTKLKIMFSENGYRFIWLSVLPILLLHLTLLNYSVHDFTVLYASLFFSVLLGILYDKLKKSGVYNIAQLNRIIFVFLLACVAQFYFINRPGKTSVFGYSYAAAMEAGKFIAQNAKADEVIFVLGKEPEPQEIWYAQRNMEWAPNTKVLEEKLAKHRSAKVIVFNYTNEGISLQKRIEKIE
ncbi:MAG: hypothetical protein KF706_06820 [Chitinophagales bacterium]|nr:hypothetical protein [Chitinophagales bacterium]